MNFYNKPCEDAVNIKPINDILLIRRVEVSQPTTASGILLLPVEESAATPWRGVVVAAGPGKPVKLSSVGEGIANALRGLLAAYSAMPDRHEGQRYINLIHWQGAADAMAAHDDSVLRMPMQVQVGDTVIFSKNGYQEYKIDGETLLAMGQDSILGVSVEDALKEYDSNAAGLATFDYEAAANLACNRPVSRDKARNFSIQSRWAHEARESMARTIAELRRDIETRDAEIELLKRSLMEKKDLQCEPILNAPEDQGQVAAEQGHFQRYPQCMHVLREQGKSISHSCAEPGCGYGRCLAIRAL